MANGLILGTICALTSFIDISYPNLQIWPWSKFRKNWYRIFFFSLILVSTYLSFYAFSMNYFIALLGCFIFGLAFYDDLNTTEFQFWDWNKFKNNWKYSVPISILICITISIIVGWLLANYNYAFSLPIIGLLPFVWIPIGLVFGFVFGIVFGFYSGLKNAGILIKYLLYVPSAYKRFWNTFWISILDALGLSMAIISGQLTISIFDNHPDNAFFSAIRWSSSYLPIMLMIPLGKSKFIQHFSLRLVLYFEGKMPLRVVTFMDRMTDQLIFEDNRRKDKKGRKRRGATWRFRHKILQDYFAGKPS